MSSIIIEIEMKGFELTHPQFGLVTAIQNAVYDKLGFVWWIIGNVSSFVFHIRQKTRQDWMVLRVVNYEEAFPQETTTELWVHYYVVGKEVTYPIAVKKGRMPCEHNIVSPKRLVDQLSSPGAKLILRITIP